MSYFNTILPTNDTTYSSAFPPLQSLPLTVNHHQQHHKKAPSLSSIGSSGSSSSSNSNIHSGSGSLGSSHASPFSFFTSLAPPKFPSYLKHTAYADIVLQQYNDRKCKKQPSSDMDLRLPQYWNKISKSRHPLQIGINGYDLSYNNTTGPTSNKKEQQAAEPITCHTNFPARPQCGVYYFEIRVLHLGQDGIFAIGFSRENHKLNKLPGCDSFSYGYHGYDGQIYQQDTKGAQYGPTFTSGDVIGCGINYANHSAFFTKNGVSLGVAFESIDTSSELLYPCVGLSTAGEAITANFGQEPFAFDIVEYVKSQQLKSMHESTATLYPPPTHIKDTYKNDVHADVDQLVLSYLLQQGYTQTAVALLKNIQQVKQKDLRENYTANEDQLNRNAIRKSIMKGSVDAAIEQTKHSYPGLLENNPDLMFQLKSRKFLDILIDSSNSIYVSDHSSDTDDDTLSTYSGRSRGQSFSSGSHRELHDHILYEEEEEQEEEEKHHTARKPCPIEHITTPPLPAAASGRRLSWAAIAAPPSFDTTVVEEMFTPTRRKSMTRMRRDSFCSIDFFEDEEHHHIKKMSVVRKAMNYGHILQEEYQHDSKYLNKLMELFTLIAYNDPKTSPMAHLLDISQRDGVATELNKAIQMYQGQPPDSSLDLIYKQSIMTNEILIYSGHGKASLLHMKSYLGH